MCIETILLQTAEQFHDSYVTGINTFGKICNERSFITFFLPPFNPVEFISVYKSRTNKNKTNPDISWMVKLFVCNTDKYMFPNYDYSWKFYPAYPL
jgi:hypothetical protein